jgi:penicillin-binding protein-related factor A (putative recombinase)
MSSDFFCAYCGLENLTNSQLQAHLLTCSPPPTPPAAAKRKTTGSSLEQLVKESAKAQRPLGLRVRKHGPEFAGAHLRGGQAVGHILGRGGLDFEGHLNGRWCGFDAKATLSKTAFPLDNVKPHQVSHIRQSAELGAIAFLLVEFAALTPPRYFAVDWPALEPWWTPYNLGTKGARASIPLAAFQGGPLVRPLEMKRAGKLLDLVDAVEQVASRMTA